MRFNSEATGLVLAEAFTGKIPARRTGRDDLCDARELLSSWRQICRKVDHQISARRQIDGRADRHRCRVVRQPKDFVRHESAVAKGPQQRVEALRLIDIVDVQMDTLTEPVDLIGQAAGEDEIGVRRV